MRPAPPLLLALALSVVLGAPATAGAQQASAPRAAIDGASGVLDYPFVAKWRGLHGHAVGLCTAELVAPLWIVTAGHCAVRAHAKH